MAENKVCYSFHLETGDFVCENFARPCPIEDDVWHFPAQTTEIAPPALIEGKWPRWTGDTWIMVPDHRGEIWYLGREQMIVNRVGDPTEHGLTKEPPPPPPVSETSKVAPNGFD